MKFFKKKIELHALVWSKSRMGVLFIGIKSRILNPKF